MLGLQLMTNFIKNFGLALTTLSLDLTCALECSIGKWFHGIEICTLIMFTAIVLLVLHNAMGGSLKPHLAAQLGNVGIYLLSALFSGGSSWQVTHQV